MSGLKTKNRKYIWLGVILVLLIPIIALGMPSSTTDSNDEDANWLDRGGKLARLRDEYSLGESNMGKIDPSSSTMNFVLLGMRGIAVNLLWMEAQENQANKNWAHLHSNVESIILLQPHYIHVWRYQGWNLAWNVSREWDAVEDRYYWVKKGGKFYIRGRSMNENSPEMYQAIGRVLGEKVGNSDEWRLFRGYFRKDPDKERWPGGKDLEFNINGDEDNYIAAKYWYLLGNKVEMLRGSRLLRPMYRRKPAFAQLSAAKKMQEENRYDDPETQGMWETTWKNWTLWYDEVDEPGLGMELYNSPAGKIRMEADTDKQLEALQLLDDPPNKFTREEKRPWVVQLQDQVAYRPWRTRIRAEKTKRMMNARKEIFEGKELFRSGRHAAAEKKLYSGLTKMKPFMDGSLGIQLENDVDVYEDVMMTIFVWQQCFKLLNKAVPEQFPLKSLWDRHAVLIKQIETDFGREFRTGVR